jgi:hypothetical protein
MVGLAKGPAYYADSARCFESDDNAEVSKF